MRYTYAVAVLSVFLLTACGAAEDAEDSAEQTPRPITLHGTAGAMPADAMLIWNYLLFEDGGAAESIMPDRPIADAYEVTGTSSEFTWTVPVPGREYNLYYGFCEYAPDNCDPEIAEAPYALASIAIGEWNDPCTFGDQENCADAVAASATMLLYAYRSFSPANDVYLEEKEGLPNTLEAGFHLFRYNSKHNWTAVPLDTTLTFGVAPPNLF